MPELVSTPGNLLAAKALFQAGKSTREVAAELRISPYSAWALKHKDNVDPESVQQCSKTLADRHTLAASLAIDTVIAQGLDGKFEDMDPLRLAQLSATVLKAAGEYNLSTGAKDLMSSFMNDYGLEASHSVSRITVTKSVSLESEGSQTPQPVVINPNENE